MDTRTPTSYARASDPGSRRSVTGFGMSLKEGPVACQWKAKRQVCVTPSSESSEARRVRSGVDASVWPG
eukprot:1758514-Rhodomonas_salina.1